jgi:hypothetical protein
MSWVLLIAGLLVLLLTHIDLVWTTLTLRGGGPITRRLGTGMWYGCLKLHRQYGGLHFLLSHCGWITLSLTVLAWLAMAWLGWTLIFAAGPQAVINEKTGEAANWAALIYFTGFALYTLGIGDYVPNGALWQILTPVAALNGFILITLSVTYLLQVLTAAVGDRKAARLIHALGGPPAAILQTAWNDADFSRLSHSLAQITALLAQHTQAHKAYPVLQFFHYADPRVALPLQTAILGEALVCLKTTRPTHHGIDPFALSGAVAMITAAWENLPPQSTVEPTELPPIATREWFIEHGLPAPTEPLTEKQQHQIEALRWRLLALALSDGWKWQAVQAEQ